MDPISEYRQWKQQGEELRAHAKHAMETRFREILTEAARIAEDYKHDFGAPLKPPAGITAFRYKAVAGKAKKAVKKPEKPGAAGAPVERADPNLAALHKRRAQIVKKLEEAKGAGKPTRNLEDRL